MSDIVKADGIVIYHKLGSSYYPIACGTSGTINITTDKLELSPYTSGKWRAYEYGRITGTISTSGLIKINAGATSYSPIDLLDYQLAFQKVLTKYVITDPNGNSRTYEVNCLVDDFTIDTEAGGTATYSMTMTMTSDPAFIQTAPDPGGADVDVWEYNATGGETTISNAGLINDEILDVRRNGIGLEVINAGSPTGSQVKYTSGSGSFEFGMALAADEWIVVIYVN
jgi:hypothetical protein